MSKEKYFNFPIQLLQNFLVDSQECLSNIYAYAHYTHTLTYDHKNEIPESLIESTDKFFGTTTPNPLEIYTCGEELFDRFHENSPHVGINLSIFRDFQDVNKSDFEKACLLAFLAIKSIIGPKPYCIANDKFLLSRMDGRIKAAECPSELSKPLNTYSTRYQLTKIKNELRLSWGLLYYARRTRGYYASFKLTLEELIYVAEKRKKNLQIREIKKMENATLKRVLDQLKRE